MMQALDLGESGLEAVPLRLELLPALRLCQRVLEDAIVFPELQFRERGAAGEEVEDAADYCLLLGREFYAAGGVDVGVFDV